MKFSDALRDTESHLRSEMGVGASADGTPAFLNGSPITVTTTPLEATQPFGMGGYEDLPTMRVAIARQVWELYKLSPLGKNRVRIGSVELRAVKFYGDPLSSEISVDCCSVDT